MAAKEGMRRLGDLANIQGAIKVIGEWRENVLKGDVAGGVSLMMEIPELSLVADFLGSLAQTDCRSSFANCSLLNHIHNIRLILIISSVYVLHFGVGLCLVSFAGSDATQLQAEIHHIATLMKLQNT